MKKYGISPSLNKMRQENEEISEMQKQLFRMCAALLLCMLCLCASAEEMRGYSKEDGGYQYAEMGLYPYAADGTVEPVLWRILDVCNGQALLLTEYAIDAQQVIFENDQNKIDRGDYRRITTYAESDLYTWMNTEALDTLMGADPLRSALVEEPGGGLLFILTDEQFLTPEYGFSSTRWDNQPSRYCKATPYARARGAYVDSTLGTTSYWAAAVKGADATHLQLVGVNGHLSWGGYTRRNVGVRMSVRLDLSQVEITGGQGTKAEPFVLASTQKAASTPVPTADAAPAADVTAVPEASAVPESTEIPALTPEPTAEPTPEPTPEPTATPAADTRALLSFVGDCSVGDSAQYVDYSTSYHSTIDEKGYAWPFSLVKDYLAADDLTIANLEVVFTTRRNHTEKLYNLKGDPDHVNVLLEGSIEMVNTVNNHCMDFSAAGYEDTLDVLDEAGIAHFGTVYPGSQYAQDVLGVQDVNGIRFGFVGFTYPQESDLKRIAERIRILKEENGCDVVIVSLHWGRETHMTPESSQAVYARQVIDAGADVIWGHHPHVIQPITFYNNKPIMFSTGNFTFGTMSKVDPSTGIFQLTYERVNGQVHLAQLQVIPCKTQGSSDFRPYVLTDEAERREVFAKLTQKKVYAKCVNPPESFRETGIVTFENGEMLP